MLNGANNQELNFVLNRETAWSLYPDTFAHRASHRKWVPYKHLKYISSKLAPAIIKGGARYIVTLPPRHGKSELISNWLPTWFLYHYPEKKVILASYAAEFASRWGAQVRSNLTDNEFIKANLSKSTKSKKQFQTLEGGQMISVGMGGPITGVGSSLFIIDDPLKNYQEAMSPLIRERHKDWFRTVALTRLEPNASMIILQTRWHEDDLSGWLLNEKEHEQSEYREKFIEINLPAICEQENDPLGRSIGDALCPERYTIEDLKKIRAQQTEMTWAALYQQRPTAMQGNIILKDWLRFYDTLPTAFDEVAIFADLSFKEGTTTDFTVVECWGRKGPNIYLVDQIRARMGFPDQIKAIKEMARRHPRAMMKQVEEAANGAAVIEVLRSELMGLVPVKPMTSKEARIAAVSPVYQGGNVWYPNQNFHQWVQNNVAELLTFPNATHDDTVDCASMAVTYFSNMNSAMQHLSSLNKR